MAEIMQTKEQVHYRGTIGMARCGKCAMYHDNTCDLVLGIIEINKVCDLWVKR